MLVINFKDNIPQQNHYNFSVVGNNKVNKIKFILDRYQDEIDLSNFYGYIKVSNDKEYNDLIPLELSIKDDEISLEWILHRKTTQYANLNCQLVFKEFENDDVFEWQSAIFNIELLRRINAEEEIVDKNPSIIDKLIEENAEQQEELDDHEERISALEEAGDSGVNEIDATLENDTLNISIAKDGEEVDSTNVELPFVKKTTNASKVYGTDANGDEKLYDANSFGQVDDVQVNGYSVVVDKVAIIDLTSYEEKANKVIAWSSTPSDAKYPSEKLVYNECANIRAVAEGKCKSYTISTTDNPSFDSQSASLSGITSITDISGNIIQVSSLKNGDVVLVVETDVPDRWYSNIDDKFYILETAKVDLTAYANKSANETITGSYTFEGNNTHSGNETFNNGIELDKEGTSGNSKWHIEEDIYGQLVISRTYNNIKDIMFTFNGFSLLPKQNDTGTIGNSTRRFSKIWTVNLDFSGALNPNANGFGFNLPDSTNLTGNKTLATQDEAFNIINASDIASNRVLTDSQISLITNGKQTEIRGIFPTYNYSKITVLTCMFDTNNNAYVGLCRTEGGDTANATRMYLYTINNSTKVFAINFSYRIDFSLGGKINIVGLSEINGKKLEYYLNNVYPYATNSTTVLEYETINDISVSADTTYTLANAPANTYPEYKGYITNSGANAITITLPSGTVIKTNDDAITISSNTFTLPASATVELNYQNGTCIVFNWAVSN